MTLLCFFFFNDPATTEIYTFPYTTLFRSHQCHLGFHAFGRNRRHEWICRDRKSTRLNSSHVAISYAVFCLKKKKNTMHTTPTNKKKKSNEYTSTSAYYS